MRIHPCILSLSFLGSLAGLCLSLVASPILGPRKFWDQRCFSVLAAKACRWASDCRDYLSVCFVCLNFCAHGFEEGEEHFPVECRDSRPSIMFQHYSISLSIDGVLESERVSVAADHLQSLQGGLGVEFLEPEEDHLGNSVGACLSA